MEEGGRAVAPNKPHFLISPTIQSMHSHGKSQRRSFVQATLSWESAILQEGIEPPRLLVSCHPLGPPLHGIMEYDSSNSSTSLGARVHSIPCSSRRNNARLHDERIAWTTVGRFRLRIALLLSLHFDGKSEKALVSPIQCNRPAH